MRRLCFPVLVLVISVLFLFVFQTTTANGEDAQFPGDYSKLSGIIIPGFASTQLRAWSILDCPYSPLDFNPLDLVWLDTTKVPPPPLFSTTTTIIILVIFSHGIWVYPLIVSMLSSVLFTLAGVLVFLDGSAQ